MTLIKILDNKTSDSNGNESADDEDDDEDDDVCFELQGASTSANPVIGNYSIVIYDGVLFPGLITRLNANGGARVSVLHRYGGGWVWPKVSAEIDYTIE